MGLGSRKVKALFERPSAAHADSCVQWFVSSRLLVRLRTGAHTREAVRRRRCASPARISGIVFSASYEARTQVERTNASNARTRRGSEQNSTCWALE